MKPSEVAESIRTCYKLRRPLFVWGPPGVGKSETMAGVAKDLGIGLVDFRMALRDPTDVKGFPMPDQKTGTMKFYRDGELPTEGRGFLFMDELNSSAQATQAAGMQLCLPPFKVGDYILPEGWVPMAAGNREGDRGVVHRMPSPLANRFTHVDYDVNADDFVRWAQDTDQSAELIAFTRFRPNLLFTFDPKLNDRAFGTPRSWVAADEIRREEKNPKVAFELIKGTVGEGNGTEFWSFINLIDKLPSVDEIKLNPGTVPIPDQPATQYAVVTTLATHTKDISGFERFMIYIERMSKEFQTVYIRDAMRKDPKIKTAKVFTKWAMKNEKVIM